MPFSSSIKWFTCFIFLFAILAVFQSYRRSSSTPDDITSPIAKTSNQEESALKGYGRAGNFHYYVLSLSWSPGFCAQQGNHQEHKQCRTSAGFVLHGLWPQNRKGYPSNCSHPIQNPSANDLALTGRAFPDTSLARYQWRKHGSCSGLPPKEYFAASLHAYDLIRIPLLLTERPFTSPLTTQQIRQAFTNSNPNLKSHMFALICKRGILQEIRICLDKSLTAFRRCEEDVRDQCGSAPVIIQP